ncbi:AAA family ATPase [Sinorhizobium medicae]|uniref:AAA family ATPase n=1 Tax=Sinorhizobium medicae TaxID=110321 RepID=UPI001F3E3807|nr:AAA family ATPase [Sinorhizobium medicae]
MEDEVARLISDGSVASRHRSDGKLILDAIAKVEQGIGYLLTDAQREAVFMATSCGVCVISGGAGTGKTIVVWVILAALETLRDDLPVAHAAGSSSCRWPWRDAP